MDKLPYERVLASAAVAALVQAALVGFACSGPFFRFNVATSQRVFGTSLAEIAIFDDVTIYHRYAGRILGGDVPYRDFLVEYPPLALPVFLLPRLFAEDVEPYEAAFGAFMLLVNAGLVYLVARRVARREGVGRLPWRLAWYTGCVAAFGSLVVSRFDFAPALIGFLAMGWWAAGRDGLAGAAAGIGALMKIFPGLIAGPLFVAEARRPRQSWLRGTLACAATVGLGGWAWLALGGARVRESLGYHLERGLEVGSVYAGVLAAFGRLVGAAVRSDYRHAAGELTAPGSETVARLAVVVQLALIGLVLWRSRRSGRVEAPRWAAAAVLAFVVGGKVLSPQYLIWLLPLVATIEGPLGPRARALFLACCAATTLVYPWSYMGLVLHFDPLALLILNGRNALLLALLGLLVFHRDATEADRR